MKKLRVTALLLTGFLTTNLMAQEDVKDSVHKVEFSYMIVLQDSEIKLIHRKPKEDTLDVTARKSNTTKKPKYKLCKNWDFYLGIGFIAGTPEYTSAEMLYGNSWNFEMGFKHYFKFGKVYAIGYGLEYQYNSFRIRDGWDKEFSMNADGTVAPSREFFRTNQFNLAFLNRFYFCKQVYLEVGVFGNWIAGKRYKTKYKMEKYNIKEVYTSGYYFNPFSAEAYAGIGIFDCVSVFGRYRFTNLFNQKRMTGELPRWSIGVLWMF